MEEEITIMSPSDHTKEDLKIELDGSILELSQEQLFMVLCNHKLRVLVDSA